MSGFCLKAPRGLSFKKISLQSEESSCLTNISLKVYPISLNFHLWGFLKGNEADATRKERALKPSSSFLGTKRVSCLVVSSALLRCGLFPLLHLFLALPAPPCGGATQMPSALPQTESTSLTVFSPFCSVTCGRCRPHCHLVSKSVTAPCTGHWLTFPVSQAYHQTPLCPHHHGVDLLKYHVHAHTHTHTHISYLSTHIHTQHIKCMCYMYTYIYTIFSPLLC